MKNLENLLKVARNFERKISQASMKTEILNYESATETLDEFIEGMKMANFEAIRDIKDPVLQEKVAKLMDTQVDLITSALAPVRNKISKIDDMLTEIYSEVY